MTQHTIARWEALLPEPTIEMFAADIDSKDCFAVFCAAQLNVVNSEKFITRFTATSAAAAVMGDNLRSQPHPGFPHGAEEKLVIRLLPCTHIRLLASAFLGRQVSPCLPVLFGAFGASFPAR